MVAFGIIIQKNKLFILCWQSPKNISKAYQSFKIGDFKNPSRHPFPTVILLQFFSGLWHHIVVRVSKPWSFPDFLSPFPLPSFPLGSRLFLNNCQCSKHLTRVYASPHSSHQGGSTQTSECFPPNFKATHDSSVSLPVTSLLFSALSFCGTGI